ncbi:MAG: dimethyl sulfoxide reductase anchor subunit [Proteobacteria bacterium]|nr:dimethyl sulfoxide reductase anchor subunit [Pseudomonadota bacterium]
MTSMQIFDPSLDKILEQKNSLSVFPVRADEPDYAKLKNVGSQESNCYGGSIPLVTLEETESLRINGVEAIGENPDRNKQHAFHFNADNCIGCHACETACSEKNDLPPHISFRSVGYIEGGTYPSYQRMNISMACNHCDDPVCLKGCPTRAYTKHEEFGAVIQDPDICFGCGYCTWVCPYNAPQLDTEAGQVEKCNMCVDRLEVGLKPACVSACVGNALDFGVVENTPEGREQIATQLPGFPDPDITKPNIRFEQSSSLPREMARTDSAPVKYVRQADGQFKPAIDRKEGTKKHWNFARLSSRENPLVLFTLATQTAMGLFITLFVAAQLGSPALSVLAGSALYPLAILLVCGLTGLGLFMSTIHLGKPMRFYRGFNNLRHSPVCREGLGILLFMIFAGLHLIASLPANAVIQSFVVLPDSVLLTCNSVALVCGCLATLAACTGLYYMYRCYRIKARPFWDHWQSASAFTGNTIGLGAMLAAVLLVPAALVERSDYSALLMVLSALVAVGIALEGIGLLVHSRAMKTASHEGAASHYIQTTTFGKTYCLRNILMGINFLCLLALTAACSLNLISGAGGLLMLLGVAVSIFLVAVTGRALFYVLVIPTTMPGAFFWKNKAFEQHARDIGLADFPQVGLVPDGH